LSPSRLASGPGSTAGPNATRWLHPIPLTTTPPPPSPSHSPSRLPFPSLFLSTPLPRPHLFYLPPPRFNLTQSPLGPFFLASSRFLFLGCRLHTTYWHTHPPGLGLEWGYTTLFKPRNLALHRQCA
ncbi:hypothetical protein COCMIDRAFT_79346, partial [Bipolaris oryzae ATCC 44560]